MTLTVINIILWVLVVAVQTERKIKHKENPPFLLFILMAFLILLYQVGFLIGR